MALAAAAVLIGGSVVGLAPTARAASAPSRSTAAAVTAVSPTQVLGVQRFAAGSAVTALVTGRGGVPSSGVGSVVVRLSVLAPASDGQLLGRTAGRAAPARVLVGYPAGRSTTATVELPVTSSGRIVLTTTAATGLEADVVGYRRGVPAAMPPTDDPVASTVLPGTTAAANDASPSAAGRTTDTATGTFTGTVQSTSRVALAGVAVSAYDGADRYGGGLASRTPVATTTTTSTGSYTLGGLAAGPAHGYELCFVGASVSGSTAGYAPLCVGPEAGLAAGRTTLLTPVQLTPGVAVSGVVRAADGTALAGVPVSLTVVNLDEHVFTTVTTAADGTFTLAGTEDGGSEVCADGSSVVSSSAPYGYVPACVSPRAVGVGGQVTGEVLTLTPGGEVTGVVRGSDGHTSAPLAGVAVSVADAHVVRTAADGSYTLTGVPLGVQHVCVRAARVTGGPSATGYLDDCDVDGSGNPTGVAVTVSATSPAHASTTLQPAAALAGTLISGGQPQAGTSVLANPESILGVSTLTDASGDFVLTGLGPGSIDVCFTGTTAPGYVPVCDTETLTAGSTTDVDPSLVAGGDIAGTVTDASGNALANADVYTFGPDGPYDSETDSQGHYVLSGIPAGTSYTVCVNPSPATGTARTGYLSGCVGGDQSPTQFTVTAGATTTVDDTLAVGAALSGRVTDATSKAGAGNVALSFDGPSYAAPVSAADGTFRAVGLAPGSYTVCSQDAAAGAPWVGGYVDTCTSSAATVTAGAATNGISLVLQRAGAIVGRLTARGGGGVGGVFLTADADQQEEAFATSASDGSYVLSGLASGTYAVCYDPVAAAPAPPTGYAVGCVRAGGKQASFTVTAGATPPEADQQLVVGAAVAGTVTDATSGKPVAGLFLDAPDLPSVPQGDTDADGHYAILGLPPQTTVSICVEPFGSDFPGAPAGYVQTCADVTLGASGSTAALNPSVQRAAGIRGTVTDAAGAALSNAEVDVYAADGSVTTVTDTAPDGTYDIDGIAVTASTTKVCFDGSSASDPTTTGFGSVCRHPALAAGKITVLNVVLPAASS